MDDMNMKNDCLNVCTGIAAFFIVFIHCNFPSPVGGMMNGLARFGVPLFFMVSGYFSYGKGMDTVKKRVGKTWNLFLAANGVYLLRKVILLGMNGELTIIGMIRDLFLSRDALVDWVLFNQSPFMWHLWFLGALLYCYLFYGLLVKRKWEERVYVLIPICLAANLILGEGLHILGKGVPLVWVRNFWLTGLPFFLLGHWMFREQSRGRLKLQPGLCLGAVLLGACLSMGEMLLSGGWELYFGSILMTAGIFLLALWKPSFGKGSLLAHIGERASVHIYLWQILVFDVIERLAHMGGVHEHMVYQRLMPLGVGIASWLLAEALIYRKKGV